MSNLHKIGSFVRWRLVPVRYVTMLGGIRLSNVLSGTGFKTAISEAVGHSGHHPGPQIKPAQLARTLEIYGPRTEGVTRVKAGYCFINLFAPQDIRPDNPVFQFAMSSEVLDVAFDYFGGRMVLDSIQVLYSLPTSGELLESQLWHKDYGDSRSLHCVAYLNDVLSPEDGPFVFVDKRDARRIARSPVVRRIHDDRFLRELGPGQVRHFYGKAGESVFVDPAACYHYGSRCQNPRLAIFVTFNSRLPFARPLQLVRLHAQEILEAAQLVRPDLSTRALRSMLQLTPS